MARSDIYVKTKTFDPDLKNKTDQNINMKIKKQINKQIKLLVLFIRTEGQRKRTINDFLDQKI